jgi:hypothetical protein
VLFCRSLFVFFCPFVFFCIELLYRNCIYLISYIVYFGRHSKFDDAIIAINIRAAMSNLDTPMECYSICKKHSSLYFQIVESRTGDTTICDKVCQWLVTGRWCSPDPPVSSTNKTDDHDIMEKLLKLALNTIRHKAKPINYQIIKRNRKEKIRG